VLRQDLFDGGGVSSTGAVDLKTHKLKKGNNIFSITPVGRNKNNLPPHYQIGIDGISMKYAGK
jgi:hypothetical protein